MAKANKNTKKNIEKWILNIEKSIGMPIVLTLLIEEGSINYISAVEKHRGLNIEQSEEGEKASINLKKHTKTGKATIDYESHYIG